MGLVREDTDGQRGIRFWASLILGIGAVIVIVYLPWPLCILAFPLILLLGPFLAWLWSQP